MSKVTNVKLELAAIYNKTANTVDRYNILAEVEELIEELRKGTVEQIESNGSVHVNTITNNFSRFLRIFSEISNTSEVIVRSTITLETTMDELVVLGQMDSLDVVELIMAVEEEYDVEIDETEIENIFYNVYSIMRYVSK